MKIYDSHRKSKVPLSRTGVKPYRHRLNSSMIPMIYLSLYLPSVVTVNSQRKALLNALPYICKGI